MARHISFEKIENFRDLGGYETSYGETSFSILYRSGSLAFCSENDVKKIQNLGIRSILDLRNKEDVADKPDYFVEQLNVKYINIEVNGKGRIAKDERDMIDSYLEMLEDKVNAHSIFKTILDSPKPMIIHCSAGKDRTGCIVMVILMANGVPFEQINADYYLSLPCLNGLAKITMEKYPDFPKEVLYPNTFFLEKVRDLFLKRYNSVDNFLATIGFDKKEINSFSKLLDKRC